MATLVWVVIAIVAVAAIALVVGPENAGLQCSGTASARNTTGR
jgi:hypothetical protein